MNLPHSALIGIGNPYRRDDGIGPALVAAVEQLSPAGVTMTVADGEPSQLLDAWSGARVAVVVDAVLCEVAVPGRIHRTAIDLASARGAAGDLRDDLLGRPAGAAGTHQLGVPDAIRLARALDLIPQRLVVFAVEAADLGFGPGLSPAVAASLPWLVRVVLAELGAVLAD